MREENKKKGEHNPLARISGDKTWKGILQEMERQEAGEGSTIKKVAKAIARVINQGEKS